MKVIIYFNIVLLLLTSIKAFNQEYCHRDIVSVNNYDINIDITDFENETIKGYTKITFEPLQNLNAVHFDLLRLNIDSIVSESLNIDSFIYNDTLISINLNEELQKNNEYKVKIYYNGQPVRDPSNWGGFYFDSGYAFNLGVGFEDNPHNYGRVWFPCIDNFTDKATYTFTITCNIDHTAVCGGELVSTEINEENQTATYKWVLNNPIPTYLASIAVGEYELISKNYNGINGEIPINYYVLPGKENNALASFQNMKNVLEIFEDKFGPYKWNRVGFVTVPFVFGAMEHATNVTISDGFINGTLQYEDLIYHELAHSWFGNLVTCETAGDMWINEGWAKYSESIYREFLYDRKNMMDFRRDAHATVLRFYHIQDGGYHALYDVPHELTYSRTVYEKGASVAHSIRGYINDDDVFFSAIAELMSQYAFDNINSFQLRDFFTEYTEIDFTDFFETHVFTPGFVHYSIDSTIVEQMGAEYQVSVYMKQKLKGRTDFANSNRIEVSFFDSTFNKITKLYEFDGELGVNSFTLPFKPKLAVVDYYEKFSDASSKKSKILDSEGVYDYNNIYFRNTVTEIDENKPAFIHVTHNWVAPDPFKEEVPGLILADHRYWTVKGIFPEGFKSSANFTYRNNITGSGQLGHLDNEFITNSLDSLRLVYRPDRYSDWEIVENATNSIGLRRLNIDNLKPGEYALAIYDWTEYTGLSLNNFKSNADVFPNPNNGIFQVEFDKNFTGAVRIFNMSGGLLFQKNVKQKTKNININCSHLPDGMYIIQFNGNNRNFKNYKLIINK